MNNRLAILTRGHGHGFTSLGSALELLTNVDGQVHQAAGVSPLVVVPGNNLHLVADDASQFSIEDRGGRVGDDVTGNQRILGVLQDALQRSFGRFLHRCVDLFYRYVFTRGKGQVSGRAGGNRYAHCEAVQLALQVRQYQRYGLGGTGGRWNDIGGGGAGAAQVLVGAIQQVLVGGVSVDSSHQTALNSEHLVKNLGHRSQAVRGAGCIRNDVVVSRVVIGVVYAQYECGVFSLTRSRNDDLLGTGVNMSLGLFGGDKAAGGLNHNVSVEFAPGQFRRIGLGARTERAAAHRDGVIGVGDIFGQTTQDRVILQKMCKGLIVGEVVNSNYLNISTGFQNGPVEVASNTAETVNTNANCHFSPPRHTPEV